MRVLLKLLLPIICIELAMFNQLFCLFIIALDSQIANHRIRTLEPSFANKPNQMTFVSILLVSITIIMKNRHALREIWWQGGCHQVKL